MTIEMPASHTGSAGVLHAQGRLNGAPPRPDAISVDYLGTPISPVGENAVTPEAMRGAATTDEYMLWEGSPSPVVLSGLAMCWLLGIIALGAFSAHADAWAWLLVGVALAALHLGYRYLALGSTRYLLSSQRLEISTGFLIQRKVAFEVYQLGTAEIEAPLLMRMFRCGNLIIAPQGITLIAIQNPEGVRDRIRDAGQTEASRWDKMRLR